MRRLRASLARLSAVAMLASLLALVGNNSANADELNPTLRWSAASLSDASNAQQLISNPQGGVTVGCSNLGSTAFRQFDGSGASVGVSNSSQPTPDVCANQSAVGADGTLYTVAYTSSSTVVAAYDGTTLKWTYQPPCGGAVRSLVVGANGNIYMVLANGSGCSYPKLVGIEPVVQSGQAEPQVVANTYIYGSVVTGGSLAAYSNGLVVRMTSGIAYFNYSGVESSNEPGTLILAPHYGRELNATTAGRVFVPMKASSSTISSCGNDQSVVGSIDSYDAGQTTATWSRSLTGCTWVYQLNPTPTGGVVAHVATQAGEKLLALSHADGQTLWELPLPSTNEYGNAMNGMTYTVDLHGRVVVEREARIEQDSLTLPAVSVTVLNPNGTMRNSFTLAGDRGAGYGYRSTTLGVMSRAIGQDTVFVSARQCTSVSNCNGSNAKLFAVKVGGLEMDYPGGAVLGQTPRSLVPEKKYAWLGDSFSSGEGAPPFEEGTDIGPAEQNFNMCHRSTKSYAHLLDQDPDRSVDLVGHFACSGATTAHIINTYQYDNQPPQSLLLTSAVDVVTVSIGGNDVGFAGFAISCVDPQSTCEGASYDAITSDVINDLPGALDAAYAAIKAKVSTSTKIVVVGYPQLIPAPAASTTWPYCVYLSPTEKNNARNVVSLINQVTQSAVTRAGSQFVFVDPTASGSPFIGRELCNDGSYFNGVTVQDSVLYSTAYSFHPNADGQRAYWQLVRQHLS